MKKKILWSLVVFSVLFAGGVWAYIASSGKSVEFTTTVVQKGDLTQTVDASGSITSIEEADLAFLSSGTVGSVFVKTGQYVEKGEVLLALDATDVEADVRRAEQQVVIAQAQLDQQLAGAKDETVAVSFAGLEAAQVALDAAKINLINTQLLGDTDVKEAEVAVKNEEMNLENLLETNRLDAIQVKKDYINAMKSSLIQVRSSIANADEVLGEENTFFSMDFSDILGLNDSQTYTKAVTAFEVAQNTRDTAEAYVFMLSLESTEEDVLFAAVQTEEALKETSLLLLYTRQVLDATRLETADLTLTELVTLKTKIDTARDALQLDESTFLSQKQLYTNFTHTAGIKEDAAEQALELAQLRLDRAKTNQLSNIRTAESTVAQREADVMQAEARLAEVDADPRDIDVAALRADVERAMADLDAARIRWSKTRITSPISGIVTNIEPSLGEQVTAGMVAVRVQTTDADQFKVLVNVSESDVTKIHVGDETEILVDALGDDFPLKGTVGTIHPSQENIEGVVFYEVDIFFDGEEELNALKPGMSVDVMIEADEVIGALFVPRRVVLEDEDGRYVRVANGTVIERVSVEVGLMADGGNMEIRSGLVEGQEVIVTIND